MPAEDLHKTEIIVDLSEPTTLIANIEDSFNPNINLLVLSDGGEGDIAMTILEETKNSHTYKLVATPDEGYEFQCWKSSIEGLLTEEQMKSETITFTIDSNCMLTAVFALKDKEGVDNIDADNIVVTATNARISVNRDEFRIYDTLGRDVTNANGNLTSGVYLVKCEGKCFKTVLN